MTYQIAYSPQARDELVQIVEWWSQQRSKEQAERWYEGILAAIDALRESPRRHPLAREHARIGRDLRELYFGLGSRPTHRVLYSVQVDTVWIVRVRHLAQRSLTSDTL